MLSCYRVLLTVSLDCAAQTSACAEVSCCYWLFYSPLELLPTSAFLSQYDHARCPSVVFLPYYLLDADLFVDRCFNGVSDRVIPSHHSLHFTEKCDFFSRYFFWNVTISSVSAIMFLSWSRNALYAWNIAEPQGIEAETPIFPFSSTLARFLTAFSISMIIGIFVVLFSLSLQLGQLLSVSFISLCIFVFVVILLCHCIRTHNMCKGLAVSHPWFLHSLTVVIAMLACDVIWLCQGLLVYRLPIPAMFQTFIPIGSFSDEVSQVRPLPPSQFLFPSWCLNLKTPQPAFVTHELSFQRLWFASGLGVFDLIFATWGLGVLAKMSNGGYHVDSGTAMRKFYGKWWLTLFAAILATPFIVASSIMPLCTQSDMLDLLPAYLPWVVVVTKIVQCCAPVVVWVFASSCRFQTAPETRNAGRNRN